MKQYLEFMRHVRRNGARKEDRTGTGTLSVFGYQMRFDLAAGFPLVTTKRVHFKSIASAHSPTRSTGHRPTISPTRCRSWRRLTRWWSGCRRGWGST